MTKFREMKYFFYVLMFLGVGICWGSSCQDKSNVAAPSNHSGTQGTGEVMESLSANLPTSHKFIFFNLVRYKNTPANLMPYLYPIKIANEKMLLNPDGSPNENAIKSFAYTCGGNHPVTLDLETWPYSPGSALTQTIRDFITAVNDFKSVNNTSPVGFYGVPPKQAYQWKNIDPVNNPSGYSTWLNVSNALEPVAEKTDLFQPSFYAYNPDTTAWRKMVDTTLAAIQRYNQNKPIYAYIWPQYHDNSVPYSLQFMDTAIWHFELEVLYDRTNGCIIWTSNKSSDGNIISWDPDMLWWQTTKSFMVEKKIVPPFVMDSFYLSSVGDKLYLHWSTSTDTTSQYFLVEQGKDSTQFEVISQPIKTLPDHFSENLYEFTNDNPSQNKTCYRLQIVNKCGTNSYSDTISTQ